MEKNPTNVTALNKTVYKKATWINSTNVYEVNLRQYTMEGNFISFQKELPRLKDMGVETLWFMPFTSIAQKNKKGSRGSYYACSDYTSVDPEFGTLEDLKNLVMVAHQMGFKIMIDWVANHTGWDHVWTKAHPDYYLKDTVTGDFKIASGMDDIIELDYNNPSLRIAMIAAMEFWIRECDIDGFRCDLAFWVTVDFWKEARKKLEKIKILFWLAEADPIEHPQYLEPFDAAYTWSWMHKTEAFYQKDQDITVLKNLLKQYDEVCGNNNILLWFTSNHDENSWNGTEYEKYGAMAFTLTVFNFTWNGIPMIYSGQELPNLKRLHFFEKDVIGWNGNYELSDFYKTLLLLRKYNPALRAADPAVATHIMETGYERVISFIRKNEHHQVLVFLNFSNEKLLFDFDNYQVSGMYKNVFNHELRNLAIEKDMDLIPWGYLVYEKL